MWKCLVLHFRWLKARSNPEIACLLFMSGSCRFLACFPLCHTFLCHLILSSFRLVVWFEGCRHLGIHPSGACTLVNDIGPDVCALLCGDSGFLHKHPVYRAPPSLPSPQDVSSVPTTVLCLGLRSKPHISTPITCLQQWACLSGWVGRAGVRTPCAGLTVRLPHAGCHVLSHREWGSPSVQTESPTRGFPGCADRSSLSCPPPPQGAGPIPLPLLFLLLLLSLVLPGSAGMYLSL